MPQDDESFLDAVLQPADEPPKAKRSPWPAPAPGESPEDGELGEAYKPDVVGPRIRNALKGGHGLAGSPKRYALLVAVLVGLASVPTWTVLRTGLTATTPIVAAPADVFLADPIPFRVSGQVHAEKPVITVRPKLRTPVSRPKSVKPVVRIRPTERSVAKKVPAERPVYKPAKPKHPKAPPPSASLPQEPARSDRPTRWQRLNPAAVRALVFAQLAKHKIPAANRPGSWWCEQRRPI